jgi:ParB-like nuclease family protein
MTTFDKARRSRLVARLARRDGTRDLLDLEEATSRLRPFASRYVGVRAIPVDRIVGTDSRGRDFDHEFRPLRRHIRERWARVEQAFPDGGFPPIVASKLGDAYFVLDGHHRVAIARQLKMETIDAEVTELTARWHLPADADVVELIHAEHERLFMEESGLGAAHPRVSMRFSLPIGYLQLLDTVQIHGYHLMRTAGQVVAPAEIADDWYSRVYLRTLDVIHAEGLDAACPQGTDGDHFLWVYETRRELVPELGAQQLGEAAARATQRIADTQLRRRRRPFAAARRW